MRHARQHARSGFLDRRRIFERQRDAADIRFVGDVGRQDFQGRRVAEFVCDPGSLGGRWRDPRFDHRYAIGREQRLRLDLTQPFTTGRKRRFDQPPRGRKIVPGHGGTGRRNFHQQALIAVMPDMQHEGAHGACRRVIGRNSTGHEGFSRRLCPLVAEPVGENGLAACRRRFDNGLSRREIVDDGSRTVHHQQRIDTGIFEHRCHRMRIARGVGIADDVDRIGTTPGARQHLVESRHRFRRDLGETSALIDDEIGGKHTDTAAIGQDAEAVAENGAPFGACRQGLDRFEKILDAQFAQHACATEGSMIDRIGTGQGACMGSRCPGTGFMPARLDDDDRLQARRLPPCRHELARVGNGFDVEQDALCLRIGRQKIEHVAEIDIGHAAQRGDGGKADAAARRPVEYGGHDSTRLRNEGDIALQRLDVTERGVESVAGRHQSQAIGPGDAQQMRSRRIEHLLLKRPPLLAKLAEASRDDHGRPRAARAELGNQSGHGLWRCRYDGQIGRLRQPGDVAMKLDIADTAAPRIDGPYRSLKARTGKILQQNMTDRAFPGTGADQGDRTGCEHTVEIADRHEFGLPDEGAGVWQHRDDAPGL